MCILDPNLFAAGAFRTFDGSNGLARHLFAEFRIIGVRLAGFIPVCDAGATFNVDTDKDFHATPLSGSCLRMRVR